MLLVFLRTLLVLLPLVALPALASAECFQLAKDADSFSPAGDRLCLSEGFGGWNLSLHTGLPTSGGGGVGYPRDEIMHVLIQRIANPKCKNCNKDEFALIVGGDDRPRALLTLYFDGTKDAARRQSGTLRLGGATYHYRNFVLPKVPASHKDKCSKLTKDGKGWRAVAESQCTPIPLPTGKSLNCFDLAFDLPNWDDSVCISKSPKEERVFVRFTLGKQMRDYRFIAKPLKTKKSCPKCARYSLVRPIADVFEIQVRDSSKVNGSKGRLSVAGTEAFSRSKTVPR